MSENKSFTTLSPEDQKEIKRLYLSYEPISQIAEKFELPRTSLDYHVKKNWSEERELMKSELFSTFSSNKRAKFISLSKSALEVIDRALNHLAERETPPTTKEMVDAMKVLDNLDKIQRLDDGDPTSITSEKKLSIREIKDKLRLDPFAKEITDADFRED